MKLRETILKEHSKANCMRIVKWVGDDQKDLMNYSICF